MFGIPLRRQNVETKSYHYKLYSYSLPIVSVPIPVFTRFANIATLLLPTPERIYDAPIARAATVGKDVHDRQVFATPLRSYPRSPPNTLLLLRTMPAESLAPGYKLVESFGPDSEYETRPSVDSGGAGDEEEVEEEVEYVTLEISGIADVDPNLLTSYRLIVSFSG